MPSLLSYVHPYLPYYFAGGETTNHDMLKFLQAKGWDITVLTAYSDNSITKEYEYDGIRVLPFRHRRDIVHAVPAHDVVMSHLGLVPRAALLCRKFRRPFVDLVHNDLPPTHTQLAINTDLAVFNSSWLSDAFPEHQGLRCIVHPPVNPDLYRTSTTKEFITLVNLWPDKGSKVFYHLAEKFPDRQFLGVLGGYGQQDIRDLPNVTIVPNTPNIRDDVFSRTKIVLMPSTYESYGRVAVEAAASGIPSIVTPTAGLKEALGASGTYVPLEDLGGWETALRKMLQPRAYNAAGKRALARSNELANGRTPELEYFNTLVTQLLSTVGARRT